MKLIALRCPNCSQPLTPENDDVVTSCAHCQTPVAIEEDGLSSLEVRFAAPQGTATDEVPDWMPYWVFRGRVQIDRRETQGGGHSSARDSEALWSVPRRLYVPAWDLSPNMAQEVGSRLAQRQPEFEFVRRPEEGKLAAAKVTPADALKLLEFVILAVEARRKDWLTDLSFRLEVGEPELWALPRTQAQ